MLRQDCSISCSDDINDIKNCDSNKILKYFKNLKNNEVFNELNPIIENNESETKNTLTKNEKNNNLNIFKNPNFMENLLIPSINSIKDINDNIDLNIKNVEFNEISKAYNSCSRNEFIFNPINNETQNFNRIISFPSKNINNEKDEKIDYIKLNSSEKSENGNIDVKKDINEKKLIFQINKAVKKEVDNIIIKNSDNSNFNNNDESKTNKTKNYEYIKEQKLINKINKELTEESKKEYVKKTNEKIENNLEPMKIENNEKASSKMKRKKSLLKIDNKLNTITTNQNKQSNSINKESDDKDIENKAKTINSNLDEEINVQSETKLEKKEEEKIKINSDINNKNIKENENTIQVTKNNNKFENNDNNNNNNSINNINNNINNMYMNNGQENKYLNYQLQANSFQYNSNDIINGNINNSFSSTTSSIYANSSKPELTTINIYDPTVYKNNSYISSTSNWLYSMKKEDDKLNSVDKSNDKNKNNELNAKYSNINKNVPLSDSISNEYYGNPLNSTSFINPRTINNDMLSSDMSNSRDLLYNDINKQFSSKSSLNDTKDTIRKDDVDKWVKFPVDNENNNQTENEYNNIKTPYRLSSQIMFNNNSQTIQTSYNVPINGYPMNYSVPIVQKNYIHPNKRQKLPMYNGPINYNDNIINNHGNDQSMQASKQQSYYQQNHSNETYPNLQSQYNQYYNYNSVQKYNYQQNQKQNGSSNSYQRNYKNPNNKNQMIISNPLSSNSSSIQFSPMSNMNSTSNYQMMMMSYQNNKNINQNTYVTPNPSISMSNSSSSTNLLCCDSKYINQNGNNNLRMKLQRKLILRLQQKEEMKGLKQDITYMQNENKMRMNNSYIYNNSNENLNLNQPINNINNYNNKYYIRKDYPDSQLINSNYKYIYDNSMPKEASTQSINNFQNNEMISPLYRKESLNNYIDNSNIIKIMTENNIRNENALPSSKMKKDSSINGKIMDEKKRY
ncbi:hypothetical protein H8356DRAFT_949179 [Neocallimastix lanati (nom. inval.)]|uniref:Uncharacterized protein n=1 Tax=Neocallimastix californiae TaxID=1754190 RepID=A0A1Y2C1X7_9FUNG|nr:hypothetical protein H8356DRAFT_949179 [Neocallimastix sp. JGI-2020a]ORY40887.1 hypothetical protein LY90DRAFT_672148 [Neocallimastix californiae]|eukprot:ORY40887.1 hypothetical protein LY90DRAFT_672148 [Neocallimastix californiae]